MHSFISNFKISSKKDWILAWCGTIFLTFVILWMVEIFWRSAGHVPKVIDDKSLWALERSKINFNNPKTVLLLGKSHIQVGFALDTFNFMCPDYQILQLAIAAGGSPVAVLNDLAVNTDFNGIIICEMSTEDFFKKNWGTQQEYVEYFHNNYNLNAKINRQISTFFQKRLVIMNPNLNLYNISENLIINHTLPTPQHVMMDARRNRYADFTKYAENRKNLRLFILNLLESRNRPQIETKDNFSISTYKEPWVVFLDTKEQWLFEARAVVSLAEIINNRGGKVVFVHFPVSTQMLAKYPKNLFWDRLKNNSFVEMIHFTDVKSLNRYQCPDGAHLDFRDAPDFTKSLIHELIGLDCIKEKESD